MLSYICPFCQSSVLMLPGTTISRTFSFYEQNHAPSASSSEKSIIKLTMQKCPKCHLESVFVDGLSGQFEGIHCPIVPRSAAKLYPDYVPEFIRNDYEEAYAILHLSPKASATLLRRCLQGIIRDFFEVKGKKRLCDEIDAIQDKTSPSLWAAMNGVRSLGNIGAHMERDVNLIIDIDPGEAEKLLKLIERIIETTYIQRHQDQLLYSDIQSIAAEKKEMRNAYHQSHSD